MTKFNKVILIIVLLTIVLSMVSIANKNVQQKTVLSPDITQNMNTAEICGTLRTAFIQNSGINFNNCLAQGDDGIEVSVWYSTIDAKTVNMAPVFDDLTTPTDQAKNICDTFFRSFPVLKRIKFEVFANDEKTRFVTFDVTSNICNGKTNQTLNVLSTSKNDNANESPSSKGIDNVAVEVSDSNDSNKSKDTGVKTEEVDAAVKAE